MERRTYGSIPEPMSSTEEKIDDVKAKAEQLLENAKDQTARVGAQASDTIDSAMTTTGEQMTHLAQTVREHAPEGKVGEIAATTATALERGGNYLKQADLDGVRDDLADTIRRHPTESLLVGLGIGFLLARSLRR